MIRRCLIAVAVVTLGLMPGCGMAVRKHDEESLVAATTVTRSYLEPSHLVAVATLEAMRAELASSDLSKDLEFYTFADPKLSGPNGSKLNKESALPPYFPAFWVEWKNQGKPVRNLMTLRAAHFEGKTRDGRPVQMSVLIVPEGGAMVTIHVDKLGDREMSRMLLDRVADRLAHPTYPPGSLEEAAMLRAFFGGVETREALPSLKASGPIARAKR